MVSHFHQLLTYSWCEDIGYLLERKEERIMNSNHFDDFTKALASSTSRRQALRTLIGTATAGLLALSGMEKVFAKPGCISDGKHCNAKTVCCSGYCDPATQTCSPAPTTTTTTTTTSAPTTTTTTTPAPTTTTTTTVSPAICSSPYPACDNVKNCGSNGSCYCLQSVEGTIFCSSGGTCAFCNSSQDCINMGIGTYCVSDPCCTQGAICAAVCTV